MQGTQTTSVYKLSWINLPTWSLWQRAAISGWAMSFPTHSGHCHGRLPMEMGQWERRTKLLWLGVGKGGVTSIKHPWALFNNNWWHDSGSEDEGQWPDVRSTCRVTTDSHPSWRSRESQNRCGLRCVSRRLYQERREIEQGGALQEYNCETWRHVTWSSNGEGFSPDRPIRPTS